MKIDQRMVKSTKAPKRLRSAKAPVMSAGVMAANIRWNEGEVHERDAGRVRRSWGQAPRS